MKALLHKSLFLLLLVVSIHLPAQSPVFTDPALDPYDVSDFNLFRSQTISTSSSFTGSGTVFSADGKKMFVLFRAFSDKVSEYELSEAFNVSTSVYSGSTEDLIVTGQDTNPMDLTFNADGSKLFIVGAKTGAIIEYILGTPYDVSTATYAGDEERFLVDFLENATGGSMAFGADGMKMFVAKANIFDDIIEEYNLSVPYDVSTATNAGTAEELDVSAQIDLGIRAFTFNANGSKLFVADCCSIVEYDLATAFDVSTAMYAGDAEKIEIKDQNLFSPRGVTFDPAGTKMYITLSRVVYEYELSEKVQYQENATNTIIDINANDGDGGADDNSVTYSISGSDADLFNITKTGIITFNDLPDFENPRDADSDNRYDIYIKATAGVDTTQIPLVIHVTDMDDTPIFTNVGVGFDVSTAVYTGLSESFLVSSEDAFASDLQFNVDGSKMYVIGSSESDVDEYSLSRAYDISTATYDGESENFSVIQQTRGNELVFSTDGKKMFVSGDNPKSVFEYHLATPFDVSTSMLTMTFSVEDQVTSGSVIRALSFRSDGLQMFVARSGGSSGIINHTYDLIVGFDLSTAVYSGKADTISRAGDGISFSDEGTKMFVTTPRDVIDEYVLDTAYTISSATFLGESESFSVEDQSEDPLSTIFNPGGTKMFVLAKNRIYEYQLASVIEYLADSGEDVLDIDANDGLGGANDISVTYNLEGADASLFTIDGFGVITFNSAPAVGNPQNADMNNIYELTVVATNSSETIRQSVVVSVIDLPTITSASSVSIDENTVGFFYKAEADTAVTFSLGTNKDESLFDLNTDSLGFITPPDFENPADQNSDNRYVVDLVATDSLGNVVTEEITILVRNVDEGSETNLVPTFISENTASVDENTPVSQVVLDVQATDGDGGAEDEGITYAISGVDATAFAIDGDDGEIRFVSIPDFENPIDDGNNNAYNITVIADDGDTINNRTTQEIVITVNDVDEGAQNMAPVFSSAGSVSIAENTPTTTIVLDVDATDGDGGAVDVGVTYLLGGVDASNFNMDADNGEIRFASSPDFENPTDDGGNNVYNITVTADDGEAENNTSMQAITITITDVDEGTQENTAPVFSSASSASIEENITITTVILDVEATDGDGGAVDQNVTYTLSGVDAEDFSIDSDDGEIRFVSVPDFENPTDDGGNNVYNITVTADDGESENNTSEQSITITVTDVDEGTPNVAPIFSSVSSVAIAENIPITMIVLDVNATDGDGGEIDQNIRYTISGVDSEDFAIDSDDGEIRFVSVPDFENPLDNGSDNVYNLMVTADDGEAINNTNVQAIMITVTDVDEGTQNIAPVFSSLSSVMVAENLPATTIVLDVNATDGDGGAVDENVTYSLSGIDAGNFTIDDNNGEIRLVSILDFEKPSDVDQDNMYDFTVTADDGELENNKTTMSVTVTVSDVDDEEQPLSIEDGNFNLLIYGNTERLYIRYAGEAAAQVAIYELTGKVVFDDTAHFINHETVIQPSLQIGQVYILMINTESVKFKIYK